MVDDTDEAIRKCNCLTELYRPLYFKGYVKFMKMSIFLLNFLIWGEKKYTHTHTHTHTHICMKLPGVFLILFPFSIASCFYFMDLISLKSLWYY